MKNGNTMAGSMFFVWHQFSVYFEIQIKQNFSIYRVYSYHPTKDIFSGKNVFP